MVEGKRIRSAQLDEAQKRLVLDNLGLVRVHLRRKIHDPDERLSTCDRADLFQEGCVGLIESVMTFRSELGVPFAAHALYRIRRSVSDLIEADGFSGIRRRQRRDSAPDSEPDRPCGRRSLPADLENRHGFPTPPIDPNLDGFRDRLEQALSRAVETAPRRKPRRADRDSLLRRIVEERLKIPEPTERKSLRRIARDAGCSYARVRHYEQRLLSAVRRRLLSDPAISSSSRSDDA